MPSTSHVLAHELSQEPCNLFTHILQTSKLEFSEIKHAQGHRDNSSDFKFVLFSVPYCLSLMNYHYYYYGYASQIEGEFNGIIAMFVAELFQNRLVSRICWFICSNKPYQCDNDVLKSLFNSENTTTRMNS